MKNFVINTELLTGRPVFLCDMFGAGTAAAGIAQAAATISAAEINAEAQADTNEMNYKIHNEDNEFNASEAEKSREFNAEEAQKERDFNSAEAQKARDWQSAAAIMERNKEAGINPVLAGENATGNNASSAQASGGAASSSPASAAGAIPMQAPQIDLSGVSQGINAALSIAKISSDIGNTKAKTRLALAQAKTYEIKNTFDPEILTNTIANQKEDLNVKRAAISQYRSVITMNYAAAFKQYVESQESIYNTNRDTEVIKAQLERASLDYSLGIATFIGNITKETNLTTMTTQQLDSLVTNAVENWNYQSGSNFQEGHNKQFGWNVGAKLGGSVSGEAGFTGVVPSGKVGVSSYGEFNGGINGSNIDSETSGFNFSNDKGGLNSKEETKNIQKFNSTVVGKGILKGAIYSRLLDLDGLNEDCKKHALMKMKSFNVVAADLQNFIKGLNNAFSKDTEDVFKPRLDF